MRECGMNKISLLLCFCRKLAVYDEWSSIVIHVALDNTVIVNEISEYLDLEN